MSRKEFCASWIAGALALGLMAPLFMAQPAQSQSPDGRYAQLGAESLQKRACEDAETADDAAELDAIAADIEAAIAYRSRLVDETREELAEAERRVWEARQEILAQIRERRGLSDAAIERQRRAYYSAMDAADQISQAVQAGSATQAQLDAAVEERQRQDLRVAELVTRRMQLAMTPMSELVEAREFADRRALIDRQNRIQAELEARQARIDSTSAAAERVDACIKARRKALATAEERAAQSGPWAAMGTMVWFCSGRDPDWKFVFNSPSARVRLRVEGQEDSVRFMILAGRMTLVAEGKMMDRNRVAAKAPLGEGTLEFSGVLAPHPEKPGVRTGKGSWRAVKPGDVCDGGKWDAPMN